VDEFPVTVPTFVAAVYDFRDGGIASATFSFDSPLVRVGVLEIAGSEATMALPDPNRFGGDIRLIGPGEQDWVSTSAPAGRAGRGIGVLDMARTIRGGGRHRATGALALHVLDAMVATAESIDIAAFVRVHSSLEPVAPLPVDWDPVALTV